MTVPVLTAVTDGRWEAALVAAFETGDHGVRVVRRCVDLPDLLATAATRTARAALLSADLRRLDRESLARLAVCGVAVVGLAADDDAERRLRQLGVGYVLPADAAPGRTAGVVLDAVSSARPAAPASEPEAEDTPAGRVVAVWGPTGAPGRTTVATTLAYATAAAGTAALLVDADTYGGSVAQALGLLDEAPGLAAAARLANAGVLDVPALAELARTLAPNLRVLTGMSRPDRWPELRAASVAAVLDLCRRLAATTVVDCGFCLEADDTSRNAATLAAIDSADTVVAVGAADPVSLHRLVRGLADLGAYGVTPEVVVNKVRASLMPGDPEREIAAALRRYAGVTPRAFLPYDRAAADTAMMRGRALPEVAPKSALTTAIRALVPT